MSPHFFRYTVTLRLLLPLLLAGCSEAGPRLTLGLIISTMAKTQLQAMQMTVFVLLPSILLSGFLFPYEGMPVPAQWVAEALPATHFVRMIRGVVLRDASLANVPDDTLFLVLFTLGGLLVATLKFRKSLD